MCFLDGAKVMKRNHVAKERLVVVRAVWRAPVQTKLRITKGLSTDFLMAGTPLHWGPKDDMNIGALAIMPQVL